MHNPYWDDVRDHAKPGEWPWERGLQIERFNFRENLQYEPVLDRNEFVARYAWTVTHPETVAFVAVHCLADGLVDPMAGTGYWGYVLGQVGVDVASYDQYPPHTESPKGNPWHVGATCWVSVEKMDGTDAVRKHPGRVLFLAWPPYSQRAGEDILRAYEGHKVIYIGESGGGCTGDEGLHDLLNAEWHPVAEHRPVQWWGLHDDITVYERGSEKEDDAQAEAADHGSELRGAAEAEQEGDLPDLRRAALAGRPG
jgi:hypothetical protein